MNRRLLAAVAALALLAGCAPMQYTKADVDGQVVCNADKMDQIDRASFRRFAQIQWVNCPTATLRVI